MITDSERLKTIRQAREMGRLPWSHLSSPSQINWCAETTLDFLLDSLTRARQDALHDAIKDACLHCRSRGSGFNTEVIRNDNGVYIHESHEYFTPIGPKIAQCKSSAIHERIKLEAARDKETG